MDINKNLLRLFKIVDLENQVDFKTRIHHYDYVQIDNKIISVLTLTKGSSVTSDGGSELGQPDGSSSEGPMLSIEQNCIVISVFDTKQKQRDNSFYVPVGGPTKAEEKVPKSAANSSAFGGACIRSLNLPWYG